MLLVGLKPQHTYLIETDDEEVREAGTDRLGTLELPYPAERSAGVRVYEMNATGVNSDGRQGAGSQQPGGKP